jgi:hypothetical protein
MKLRNTKLGRSGIVFMILTLHGLLLTAGHAQSGPITNARIHYDRVNRELKSYRRVERDLPGYSTEGGKLTGYFAPSSPRRLVARYFGESGRSSVEYNFWNNRLFFVLHTELRYDKPFGKVVQKTQNRYYFNNGKLIEWDTQSGGEHQSSGTPVDPEHKSQSLSTPVAPGREHELLAKVGAQREREVLQDARRLLAVATAKTASRR